MRKPSKRFARKKGNAFLVELRPSLYALGVMHDDGCTTFSKKFYDSAQAEVELTSLQDKLFTVSVQVSFFRNSLIFPVSKLSPEEMENIPVSNRVIRLKSRKYDHENPFGHGGPFPYEGGHLVEVTNPLTPCSSSDAVVIRPDLSCDTDLNTIKATEISALYVNYELKERLITCYLSGHNVDAFKARAFNDCEALTNEYVLNTHWYKPREMPLLGLTFNKTNNKWETAEHKC